MTAKKFSVEFYFLAITLLVILEIVLFPYFQELIYYAYGIALCSILLAGLLCQEKYYFIHSFLAATIPFTPLFFWVVIYSFDVETAFKYKVAFSQFGIPGYVAFSIITFFVAYTGQLLFQLTKKEEKE